jgi:putative oxidoreductase
MIRGAFLQRLFSSFPAEWPGVGLLLLRALVGVQLIWQSVAYLNTSEKGVIVWTMALMTFASGILLLGGLLTPLVALFAVLGGVGFFVSFIPLPNQSFLNNNLAIIDLIVLAIAIAALGPGAFSLDAWMFGRREIPIPPGSETRR